MECVNPHFPDLLCPRGCLMVLPGGPKEQYYAELDYCNEYNIPVRIERLQDSNTGKEFMMVLKRKWFPKMKLYNAKT